MKTAILGRKREFICKNKHKFADESLFAKNKKKTLFDFVIFFKELRASINQ